jgi:hypothetical protein
VVLGFKSDGQREREGRCSPATWGSDESVMRTQLFPVLQSSWAREKMHTRCTRPRRVRWRSLLGEGGLGLRLSLAGDLAAGGSFGLRLPCSKTDANITKSCQQGAQERKEARRRRRVERGGQEFDGLGVSREREKEGGDCGAGGGFIWRGFCGGGARVLERERRSTAQGEAVLSQVSGRS